MRLNPLGEKLRAFLKVVGVFLVLTGIWTLYRLWSVNLIIYDGEMNWRMFFVTQIVFQLLLTLLPILFIVRYVEKRRIGSIGLSRQKFIRNAFFGIFLSLFNSIAFVCLAYVLFVPLGAGPITLTINPENLGLTSIFLMPLTFFLVVGPSEEIETRGYFQTRLLEHFGPRFAIIFSSMLFALAHVPIDILIWRYDVWMMLFHLLGVFVSGSIMGYLYYLSGVLTGPIFLHAFLDTQSLAYGFSFDYERLSPGVRFGIEGLIWTVVTILTFLLIRLLTSKLGLKIENLPWETTKTQQKGNP
ncbi:CPBP family intramembrane metalloprotease [Candidatus Bathyarchaeota archaeon]|nr:MAG: CPBP family intramembrane metalloprotease [Candidatus Bathyarchaeota archaeon]